MESRHPDDHSISSGAQKDSDCVKDNSDVFHNSINVHCGFAISDGDFSINKADKSVVKGHSAAAAKKNIVCYITVIIICNKNCCSLNSLCPFP